jgi:hypothetical protein
MTNEELAHIPKRWRDNPFVRDLLAELKQARAEIATFDGQKTRVLANLEVVAVQRDAALIKLEKVRTELDQARTAVGNLGDTARREQDCAMAAEARRGAALVELEKARTERDNAACLVEVQRDELVEARDQRNAAYAMLREAKPHIERAMVPYKDGWIEEKSDLLARIAELLGEK